MADAGVGRKRLNPAMLLKPVDYIRVTGSIVRLSFIIEIYKNRKTGIQTDCRGGSV